MVFAEELGEKPDSIARTVGDAYFKLRFGGNVLGMDVTATTRFSTKDGDVKVKVRVKVVSSFAVQSIEILSMQITVKWLREIS